MQSLKGSNDDTRDGYGRGIQIEKIKLRFILGIKNRGLALGKIKEIN